MSIFRRDVEPHPMAAKPVAYNHERALVASAQRVSLKSTADVEAVKKRRSSDTWQVDAWEYFDAIGEIKYAGNLIGSIMSRVRIFPAVVVNQDEPPAHVTDVPDFDEELKIKSQRALKRLESANGGHSGLLSRGGVNIWVAGECNLVQIPEKIGSDIPETWDIKSVDELVVGNNGKLALKKSRHQTMPAEELGENAFVGRIWRSHPRYSDEADSSLRAVRDPCDELLLYSRLSRTVGRSRMNAGALLLPDGLALAGEVDADTEIMDDDGVTVETEIETDEFEDELMAALTSPIIDEDAAHAVVPMLIRGPSELLKEVRHLMFERTLDPHLTERADRALERVLQGLDMPKDVVTGLANVKYSNAVQIDESLYKAHIEPLILLLVDALTAVYLRPALESYGISKADAANVVVWYDPSEILTRPNRAESANEGYDRMAISDDAWRRAHGFNEADAPTPEEMFRRIVLDRAPVSEAMADAFMKKFVPQLLEEIRSTVMEGAPTPELSPRAEEILNSGLNGDSSVPPPQPTAPPPSPTAAPAAPNMLPPVPTPSSTGG